MTSIRPSEMRVDTACADQTSQEHGVAASDSKPSFAEMRGESPLDGSLSPRGLSIQFPVSNSPLNHKYTHCESPSRPEGSEAVTRPRVAIAGDLANDLRQIQRELNWLARTENMKLTHGVWYVPNSSKDESRRWSSLSDDSNETLIDDESLNLETLRGDNPRDVPDRLKVLGAELDLRNAVVQRLAELREQRNEFCDVNAALRQLVVDYIQLGRAIAHSGARKKAVCASLLILLSALVCKSLMH